MSDRARAPVVSIARIGRMLSFSLAFIAAGGGGWYAGVLAATPLGSSRSSSASG